MARVCLLTMATGRYRQFLPQLVSSAREHVVDLGGVCVLTESPIDDAVLDVSWLPWGHLPWPYPTLMRYRAFDAYRAALSEFDVILYSDVDMLFVGNVDVSDVRGTFAVLHPHFEGQDRVSYPYDGQPESTSHVKPNEGRRYYCGGVQGGSSSAFLGAAAEIAGRIEADLGKGVVPAVHDESAWNRYCIDHPPARELSSEYCTPELLRSSTSRILALDKDHAYFRQLLREDAVARVWRAARAPFRR